MFRKKIKYFVLAFVFIFSFRAVYGFRHNSFGQDFARDLTLTQKKIEQEQVLVGYGPKASVGDFYLPPFYYQLMLVLGYVTQNFVWTMMLFVLVLESLTPILLYLILRQLKIKRGFSLGLAGLYVIAGLPTIFGTFAWNPNSIPFFSTLALYGWLRYLKDKVKWPLVIGPLLIAICVQLHYQAVVLAPFVIIFIIYSLIKRKQDWKYWLIGFGLGLLTVAPYFYFESQNNWQNTQNIVNYFQAEHSQYYERVSKPDYVLTFLPSFFERVLVAKNLRWRWLGRTVFFLGSAIWVYLLMFRQKISQKQKKILIWLAVYFGSILLMLRVYKGDKIDYYMSTLYLFPFVLLGLISRIGKLMRLVVVSLVLIASFRVGQYYSQLESYNELAQLRTAIDQIRKTFKLDSFGQAAVLFHQDDYINSFGYVINSNYGLIEVNQQSQNLVQVCSSWQVCKWDGVRQCKHSRPYTYASLIKAQAGYDRIKTYKVSSQLKLVLGKLRDKPQPIGYQLNQSNLDYGTDLIYQDYYFYDQQL